MAKTYAVGTDNRIVRLDNHTGPWIQVDTINGNSDTQWNDVMSDPVDETKVIVVGSNFDLSPLFSAWGIQVSSDSGATWALPGGTWQGDVDNQIIWYELWYVDTNIIWAIGAEGYVAISTDGGLNFNLVSTQIESGLYFYTAAIFATNATTAVVLGNKWPGVTSSELYVWKTTDSGATWTMLNGATSLPAPINGSGGGLVTEIGTSNGIWMSPDEQTIIAGSSYNHYVSTDAGVTWVDVAEDILRSGVHLTWFPAYDALPEYFRHVGGESIQVAESTNNGTSFTRTRSLLLGDAAVTLRGAHFYAPFNGYYTIENEIFHTTDGAQTGTLSFTDTDIPLLTTFNAVWTSVEVPPFTQCYELTDCAGILQPIFTQSDLSAHDGQVITLADSTNHEIEGCWLVTATTISCPDTEEIKVYKCHDTCEDCLPTPLPIQHACPRPVNPGYDTGLCDTHIVEKVKCSYSTTMYEKMMAKRFAIDFCCSKDEAALFIKYEKIRLKLLTSTNPTPDPCDPKCFSYEINIIGADSAVTTYIDCFEVAQVIITPVDRNPVALPRKIEFCALDTSLPTTVVTHPNNTTDTYILEKVQDCVV